MYGNFRSPSMRTLSHTFRRSVRPVIGKLVVNIDVSNLVVYVLFRLRSHAMCRITFYLRHKWTSLIGWCLELLARGHEQEARLDRLSSGTFSGDDDNRLFIALKKIKVAYSRKHPLYDTTKTAGQPKRFSISGFTVRKSAMDITFMKDGRPVTVYVSLNFRICAYLPPTRARDV